MILLKIDRINLNPDIRWLSNSCPFGSNGISEVTLYGETKHDFVDPNKKFKGFQIENYELIIDLPDVNNIKQSRIVDSCNGILQGTVRLTKTEQGMLDRLIKRIENRINKEIKKVYT